MRDYPVKTVLVLNKRDLIGERELQEKLNVLNGFSSPVVAVSALHGYNLNSLIELIRAHT